MQTHWILIANAASARIFRRDLSMGRLIPVATLVHDKSRQPGFAFTSDRPGSYATDYSSRLHHFEPRSDARRKEHQRFAKEIAQWLEDKLGAGEFDSLTLFASNPFMGELRTQLSDAVTHRIKATLNNDLSHVGIAELDRRIAGTWSAML